VNANFNFIFFIQRNFKKLYQLNNQYLFRIVGDVLQSTYTLFYKIKLNPDDRVMIMLDRIMGMTYKSDNHENHNTVQDCDVFTVFASLIRKFIGE
jgi:hypothetical protein